MLENRSLSKIFFFYLFYILGLIYIIKPSYAFIPNVYEPNIKELKLKALSLGKTAEQLLYFGQTKRANQLAELAIQLNSKDDRLWGLLAETQIRINKLDIARKSLQQAQLLNPKQAKYWFKEASIDFNTNNIKNSIKLINTGLNIDPNSYNGYFQLGNSRIVQKEYTKALSAFVEAYKIKPSFWQALNNQGLVHYELNEKEKAILIWEKVLKIQSDAEPMLALATAKYTLNIKDEKSILLAKEALLKNPNYVSESHQKEQLWGSRLRQATQNLLKDPKMKNAVIQALANSTIKNGS
tara:strand:+ start:2329 stop:3216 length:888 start_codon:yes stop_codon:yes gene_type:complete